ncbi:MAG: hypothetical protein AUH85_15885 [Chloroflexi bacterium 13_1_40CM_4_68_4]|nr:MAG: hypothetical protein AUH85_15885 [Chloroflexi bacterium 13_1_40CM_4_68_4]
MFRWRRRESDPALAPARPADVLRQIHNLEVRSRVLADEMLLGTYRSVFRGSGLEFEEVREYEQGDDIRSIDWNVTARMGSPFVKKYREDRELAILLMVDVSSSTWFGSAERSKRELAAEVGTILAAVALRNNDRVGLVLFSDHIERYLPPRAGRDHLLRVIRELVSAEPVRARTDIGAAVRFLRNVTKKHAVVFLLSDFLDADFSAPLRRLAQKHDVIALTLNDPRELDLPAVGVIALEDAETGAIDFIDTSRAPVRESYARAARERRIERRRAFVRMAVDVADLSTDRPFVPALQTLFNARSRRH